MSYKDHKITAVRKTTWDSLRTPIIICVPREVDWIVATYAPDVDRATVKSAALIGGEACPRFVFLYDVEDPPDWEKPTHKRFPTLGDPHSRR